MTDQAKSGADGFLATLGAEVVRATADEVLVTLTVSSIHLQPFGILHGGVHCSLIETAASVGAWVAAGRDKNVVGVENHTSFLKPAKDGAILSARATPVSVGRRAHLWTVDVTDQEERLLASGRVRLMVL